MSDRRKRAGVAVTTSALGKTPKPLGKGSQMTSVTISTELAKYLAARGVFLDAFDEEPVTEEMFIPSAEDEAELIAMRAEQDAREQDEEDARRYCEWVEIMEREHPRD